MEPPFSSTRSSACPPTPTVKYPSEEKPTLCSPGSSVLYGIADFQELPPEAQRRLVVKFLPNLQLSMTPQEIHFFEAAVGMRYRWLLLRQCS